MKNIKNEINEKLTKLQEDYEYYVEKMEDIHYKDKWYILEAKCHDLRIEINVYYEILDFLESKRI